MAVPEADKLSDTDDSKSIKNHDEPKETRRILSIVTSDELLANISRYAEFGKTHILYRKYEAV